MVPSIVGIWALSKAFDDPSTSLGMVIGSVVAWVAIGFFGVGMPSKKRLRVPPVAFKRESFGALAVVVLPLALFVASFATVNECMRLGREAQEGWPVSDPRLLGVPFIGVRAELVTVRWTGRSPGTRLPRCLLYLGNADGQVIVYSARTEATIRLPVDAVELGVGYSPVGCFL